MTHDGGADLLHRVLTQIGFNDAVASARRRAQRNNRDRVGQRLLAWRDPMILGLERLEPTPWLRQHGVVQSRTGLPRDPDATTRRRVLVRVAPPALPQRRALHDRLLHRMSVRPRRPARLIVDVDSTVVVVDGHQEQARIGDTPITHGRPSSPPRRCFEGPRQDCWHGEVRPGDAHTASGTLDRLPACVAKIPAGVRSVMLRADKGCSDHPLVEWLEAHAARLVIVARLTAPITRTLSHWRSVSPRRGIETADCRSQPTRWPHAYRVVVVRRPPPDEPTAQVTLFTLGTDHSQVLVTNLPLPPLTRWRCYNDRAGVERLITQLTGDDALGRIPPRHCCANATSCHLLVLADHLVNWFTRLGLPPELQTATRQTLRQRILVMPAPLLRTDNRPRVVLPASGPREAAWTYARRQIETRKL